MYLKRYVEVNTIFLIHSFQGKERIWPSYLLPSQNVRITNSYQETSPAKIKVIKNKGPLTFDRHQNGTNCTCEELTQYARMCAAWAQ